MARLFSDALCSRRACLFLCTIGCVLCIYLDMLDTNLISSHLQTIKSSVSENLRKTSTSDDTLIINSTAPGLPYHTSDAKLPPQGPVYISAKAFLNTPPDTGDFLSVAPVQFLTGVKNPCFALTNSSLNVGNIDISTALENGYEIRCLPYFYLAGFTKSGTSDIFGKLKSHHLISGGYRKTVSTTGEVKETQSLKEAHFWDNMFHKPNIIMDNYSRMYGTKIVDSFRQYGTKVLNGSTVADDYRNLLYCDGTPRTIWHGDTWDKDFHNINQTEPKVLLPHKLHHALPDAKILLTLRNPADRLLSGYKYYNKIVSAEGFHSKVVDAVNWWNNCTQNPDIPNRACAYGKAPEGLPDLGHIDGWHKNDADRLRISIYDVYIKDWLEIFPKKNFLFIKFEEYIKDPVGYMESYILPFLGLPPYNEDTRKVLAVNHISNRSSNKLVMLPETKEILENFFKKTKESLVSLLNDKRFLWND